MSREGELPPVWAFFGYDEPNYTYMKDGRKLLSQLAALSPVPVYVRAHNLLTSGDGTPSLKWGSTNAYTEDAQGRLDYDWTIVDRIFDTYVERGMRPLVEIGFMPEALTTGPPPYRHSFSVENAERHLHGLGLPAEGLLALGRARAPMGAACGRAVRPDRSRAAGCGRSGTSRTSAIGKARPRSTTSSTTTRSTR